MANGPIDPRPTGRERRRARRERRQIRRGTRAAPIDVQFQAPQFDLGEAGGEFRGLGQETRGQQQTQLDALRAEAEGRGIGQQLVAEQLRRGQTAAARQGLALASAARGPGAALAGRTAQLGAAAGAQEAAGQAATLQAQQALAARQQLTGALEQQRAQDLQAQGLDVETALQQAQLETQQQQIGAGLDIERFAVESGAAGQRRGQNIGLGQMITEGAVGLGSAAFGGAGTAGGFGQLFSSDIRGKADIEGGADEAQAFLDAIEPSEFRRKGETERKTGAMIQDMERSEAGRALVVETPEGKKLDTMELQGTQLAALGQLNQRLKSLESVLAGGAGAILAQEGAGLGRAEDVLAQEQDPHLARLERLRSRLPEPTMRQGGPPLDVSPEAVARLPREADPLAGLEPPRVRPTAPPPARAVDPERLQAFLGARSARFTGPRGPGERGFAGIGQQTLRDVALARTSGSPFEVEADIAAEEAALEDEFLRQKAMQRRTLLGGLG